jgi:hypothetical protein
VDPNSAFTFLPPPPTMYWLVRRQQVTSGGGRTNLDDPSTQTVKIPWAVHQPSSPSSIPASPRLAARHARPIKPSSKLIFEVHKSLVQNPCRIPLPLHAPYPQEPPFRRFSASFVEAGIFSMSSHAATAAKCCAATVARNSMPSLTTKPHWRI